MTIDELIVISNIALVAVTFFAAWTGLREAHRHEEHETDQMAKIVHEVLEQEKRHDEEQEAHDERN